MQIYHITNSTVWDRRVGGNTFPAGSTVELDDAALSMTLHKSGLADFDALVAAVNTPEPQDLFEAEQHPDRIPGTNVHDVAPAAPEPEPEPEPERWTREELDAKPFKQLREIAREYGIKGRSRADLTSSLEGNLK
jgi:hypothetical protein